MNMNNYTGSRQRGQTTSNIGLLLMNPKAKMVVHSYHMKRTLSQQYNLDENRFITVDELNRGGAAGMDGPLFYDAPAVAELTQLAAREAREANKYTDTKDFMKSVLQYCKENNVSVMFVPN